MKWSAVVRSLVVLFLATSTWALDGRKPGSVLVFPVQRTGPGFTVLSVTNNTPKPSGPTDPNGATLIHWEFVNVVPGSTSLLPDTCTVNNRREYLTPADTRAVLAACVNPGSNFGYAVVAAQDPSYFDRNWSHNHLMGSEVVVNPSGGFYILNALPFSSPQPTGSHTDNDDPQAGVGPGQGDGDGQLDFDDLEYEGIPDDLLGDHFLALSGSTLTLVNFSGGAPFVASVDVDVWNDNEYALSTSFAFRCWMDERLSDLSPVFTANYLTLNTPDDPKELDVDCDEVGDLESGWFRIRGREYSSGFDTCDNPALLGALSFGPSINGKIDGAHLLWESRKLQYNGDFFKSSTNDPECSAFGQTAGDTSGGDPIAAGASSGTGSEHGAPVTVRAGQEATNRPPACNAGPAKSGEVGVPVSFDGSGSFDWDGTIVRYDWNFGDGSDAAIDVGPTPSHTYAKRGTYVVTLRVMDDRGSTSSCSTRVTVRKLPFCEFDGAFVGSVLNPIEMFAAAAGGENSLVQFDWDFGDGTSAMTLEPVVSHVYDAVGTYPVSLTVTDSRGRQSTCSTTATARAVSGGIAFTNDDADDHCQASLCGEYVPRLLQWCLDHSRNQGTGILAVGLQPSALPVFLSLAEIGFDSWLPFLDDPATPVTRVVTPAELFAVDFDDYAMVYVPSFEGHTVGGISQEMIDALIARKADLAEYVLQRGGSLLALTQSEDDDFDPQVMNGYGWSPIPFSDVPVRFFEVVPTSFALGGAPGVAAPLPGITAGELSHEAWHGYFVPDPVLGFSGLEPTIEGNEPGVLGQPAAIAGVPTPGIASQLVDELIVCDVDAPTTVSLFDVVDFDASASFSLAGSIVSYGWDFGDGSPFALNGGPTPSHVYTSAGEFTATVVLTDDTGSVASCSTTVSVEDVSGGLVFSSDDAEEHCAAFLCDAYVPKLFQWCLDQSHNQGAGILAVGVQPTILPTFFSDALFALNSWISLLDDPMTPVTIVDTPAELMAENFDAYAMVFVPSFEGQVKGGITEEMLDALEARKGDLEDYTLRRGGSLLVLTQHADPNFTPPTTDGYGFSPIPLTPVDMDFISVQPTPAALFGTPAYPAPLPGTTGPGLSHEAFHGWFEPDPVNGFFGLDVFVVGDEPGALGEAVVIGGVPVPPVSSANLPPLCSVAFTSSVGPGQVVQFDASASFDPDGVIIQYDWDFGDGSPVLLDGGPMPAHLYGVSGVYTAAVTLIDDDEATATCTVDVVVNELPFCDAGNDLQANVGEDVFFDGTGSFDFDGTIVKFTWNFGDGIIGDDFGPTPTHFYTAPGVYTVLLTVTDDLGGTSTCSTQVFINALPICVPPSPLLGQVGEQLLFDASGSVDPDGTIVSYDWDFGDGSILFDSGPLVMHAYAVPGLYVVTLNVTDDEGAIVACTTTVTINSLPICEFDSFPIPGPPLAVQFDAIASFDPDGMIVRYDWDFGDGSPILLDGGPTPIHVYAVPGPYVVSLALTDDLEGISQCTEVVLVNAPPVCDAGPPQLAQLSDTVTFDGSASFDPDGVVVQFDWDFGDGSPILVGAGPVVSHEYAAPGFYVVTLLVIDDFGAISACSTTVEVNEPPDCDAGPNVSGDVGEILQFDASASFDPDGVVVQYDWDFGDGSPRLVNGGPTPAHAYFAPGSYTVMVRLTDDSGAVSSCTTLALVNAFPVCDAGPAVQGPVGSPFVFDATASFDPDGTIVQFDWNFGDGSPEEIDVGPTPTHTYGVAGTYTVVLTVTDEHGASSSCTGVAIVEGASGAIAFSSDDAEDHCQSIECDAYVPLLLQWALDNSQSDGEGILAVGVQPTVLPISFSLADQALQSWVLLLDDPSTPVQLVSDPAAFMAEDLDDYAMVFVPSFEQVVEGGISQEMIDALVARRDDLEDWCLRRGGSLVALTQIPQPGFDPPIQNAYAWSPVEFTVDHLLFEEAEPTAFGLNGVPASGIPAPLPGVTAAGLSHEAWHGIFVPDPVTGFRGLGVIAVGNEAVSAGLPVVIGGIPTPLPPNVGDTSRRPAEARAAAGASRGFGSR